MSNPNYSLQGIVARALARVGILNDGSASDPRGPRFNAYSEQGGYIGLMGEPQFADEGSLLMATMTPSQTALQLGLSATYSATTAALVIRNNAKTARLLLREIHFLCAVAPTSGTGLLYATEIDNGVRQPTTVAAVGSPATATAYLATVNGTNYTNPPVDNLPSVWFPISASNGAAPAVPGPVNAVNLVGNGNLRSVIPVGAATSGVQDDYRIVFGANDRATGATLKSSAAAAQIIEPHVAVSLDPGAYFLLHLWAPSNITAGFAFAGLDVAMVLR